MVFVVAIVKFIHHNAKVPSIETTGLYPPPKNWNSSIGENHEINYTSKFSTLTVAMCIKNYEMQ